jgi:DNA repair protein RadC
MGKRTVNAVNIRMAEMFIGVVGSRSRSTLVPHKHPTGDAAPSPEDVRVTGLIFEAGKLLDVQLSDHIR